VPEYLHGDAFFYSEVFWAIEAEAKRRGYLPLNVGVTNDMEVGLIPPALPEEMRFVGLLAAGVMSAEYMAALCGMGLPILSVDIEYGDLPVGYVGSANLSGGYAATKYLIDCGHREIGFMGPINTALSIYERYCGFKLALRRAGIAGGAKYDIVGDRSGFQLFDAVDALEPHLNEIRDYPTAWFCAGDRIAIALCNLLARRGVSVPDDVSVMGFDGLNVSEMFLPRLSTVHVDRKRMGREAVAALCALADDPERAPVNVNVLGTVIERDSVRMIERPSGPPA